MWVGFPQLGALKESTAKASFWDIKSASTRSKRHF
jgi:hypothetical protein